eukprot:TRINITY_DN202_c0_g2_i8.p1 TRINITY_DN202_c0_g2~~TRINITY_DN202_c0_g2_i8.p1  ORF type:complete len:187 (-),score=51.87 TRINITY_DN202_c0_g2_i8:76-636(-)
MLQGGPEINPDDLANKIEHTKRVIEEVNQQFQNEVCHPHSHPHPHPHPRPHPHPHPHLTLILTLTLKPQDLTTFVCVCIPEFLSLYETERLVQELTKFKIDVDNVIINQVLFPDKGSTCGFCQSRVKMQQKYIDQIQHLYEDFHVIKLPLLKHEVRGKAQLDVFSKLMLESYEKKWSEGLASVDVL